MRSKDFENNIASLEENIFEEGYRQGWDDAIKKVIKMLDNIQQKEQ